MAPMSRGTLLQFGAGSIGRSFIAQIFARSGYQVVFVDVDKELVREINRRGGYEVVVKKEGSPDYWLPVSNVRAIDAADEAAVIEAVVEADYAATAVGKAALPSLAPVLARGIASRGGRPLDIILAENARDAAETLRQEIQRHSAGGPGRSLGLVETSIGKMVPLMTDEDRRRDRLRVTAEEYNELICDRRGFVGPLPEVPDLHPVDNIRAYVDRKLFVHNLGHAAVAYVGYRKSPRWVYIAEAMEDREIRRGAYKAMKAAAKGLLREYADAYSDADLEAHIQDLLQRFSNRALGDTLYRVGRDLPRKLSRDDRIVGAMLLAGRHGVETSAIAVVYRAALGFRATGPEGRLYPADEEFHRMLEEGGLETVLESISGLGGSQPDDRAVAELIRGASREDRLGSV